MDRPIYTELITQKLYIMFLITEMTVNSAKTSRYTPNYL